MNRQVAVHRLPARLSHQGDHLVEQVATIQTLAIAGRCRENARQYHPALPRLAGRPPARAAPRRRRNDRAGPRSYGIVTPPRIKGRFSTSRCVSCPIPTRTRVPPSAETSSRPTPCNSERSKPRDHSSAAKLALGSENLTTSGAWNHPVTHPAAASAFEKAVDVCANDRYKCSSTGQNYSRRIKRSEVGNRSCRSGACKQLEKIFHILVTSARSVPIFPLSGRTSG